MSEPDSSVSSDTSATSAAPAAFEVGEAGSEPRGRIAETLDEVRNALAALNVPANLRRVEQVDTVADLYDDTKQGELAPEPDQYTGLLALLHRVVTTMRASHAIEGQASEDEETERHLLTLDRNASLTADFHVLTHAAVGKLKDLEHPAFRREQLAANLSRASEEARWLYDTLSGLLAFSRKQFAETGAEGACSEHIPSPLFAARTAAGAVYSLLLIAYLEVARPDDINTDEAELLAEVLTKLRNTANVLTSYGVRRGMLQVVTDAKGRKGYRVVDDIVAAAAGAAGTDPSSAG